MRWMERERKELTFPSNMTPGPPHSTRPTQAESLCPRFPIPSGASEGGELVPSSTRTACAHLELDHFSHVLELGEHVVIEVQELLVSFLFAVLQTCVGVIVVPSALLHPKCHKHAFNKKGGTWCRKIVLTWTPAYEGKTSAFQWWEITHKRLALNWDKDWSNLAVSTEL